MLIVDDLPVGLARGYRASVVGAVDQQVQGVLVVDAAIVDQNQIGRLAGSMTARKSLKSANSAKRQRLCTFSRPVKIAAYSCFKLYLHHSIGHAKRSLQT